MVTLYKFQIYYVLAFFEGEIDGGVALPGGVPGDGLVRARVGRLHARDLQPDQVEHLALVLRQRHLVAPALHLLLVVVPADEWIEITSMSSY